MQFYPEDGDITVTETEYISYIKHSQNFTYSQKNPRYCRVILALAGSARYEVPGSQFAVQPGEVLFFPPNINSTIHVVSEESWQGIVIGFHTAEDPEKFPIDRVLKPVHGNRLEELFRQANEVWSACAFGYKLRTKAIISQILFEMLRESVSRHFGSNTALSALKAASDYMEQHYKEKITVEELAAQSGYSASHFARQFAKVYGISPIQYLNEIRILHAKNLLRTEQYSMAEIAQKCGFSNVYYFSRCFKQLTGIPPTKW